MLVSVYFLGKAIDAASSRWPPNRAERGHADAEFEVALVRLQKRTPPLVDGMVLGLSMPGHSGLDLPRCAVAVRCGLLGGESLDAIAARLHRSGKTVSNGQTRVDQGRGWVTALGRLQCAQSRSCRHGWRP
jgi:hypothetical protein